MVSLLQDVIHKLWESRNQCLHNNTHKEYITKETELLNSKISDEYHRGLDGLHPDYHDVFIPTKDEVTAFSAPEKKRWLETVAVYRKRARITHNVDGKRRFYSAQDKVTYEERKKRLKRSSTQQFCNWWMKTHPHPSDLMYNV